MCKGDASNENFSEKTGLIENAKNIFISHMFLFLERGNLLKLKRLAEEEVVKSQQRGYFDEHLATLYSTAYGQPYLYEDKYLLYADSTTRDVSLTLFRLDEERGSDEERVACIRELTAHFKPHKLTITSPSKLPSRINDFVCRKEYNDKDYQIDLEQFDENLLGRSYKNLRYHVNHAKRCGYVLEEGKTLTSSHINIIAHFLEKSRNYESWDMALYLGLSEYVSKFASPRLFNVFSNGILIGFDVIDALSDVITTPIGFYLDYPSISDFLVYQEILYAKRQRFKILDIGWGCNNPGLESFKIKWKAIPRFHVCMQVFIKGSKYLNAQMKNSLHSSFKLR